MAFYVYILECRDGSYYTGSTDDLERRFAEHQAGIVECCTYNLRPLKLVYTQMFPSREEAFKSEFKIKGWSRAKKQALIRGDWNEISRLSKARTVGNQ
jgi:predicted GIY-YIG superfamily endonuclease